MDTFRGYTPDYATPSLKNDLEVAGARLRISLDLEPVSVNRFALDVRRLDAVEFNLRELVSMDVISSEAAAFLVVWLERGGNVTIIGETGTGKTTLLNALDEQVNPRLRRVYIEDAVETRSLLEKGYHQLKIKVDPIDRGRTIHSKESEIVKVLHRSPDIVVLSEIQSEEHSRAFFHSLSAGIRGMQTFHSTSSRR
jgi:pilus assembly protein CpaF